MIKKLLFHCLFILGTVEISGQVPYAFTHIDTHGAQVNSIFKDKYGIIWFGTSSGLMRWDDFEQNKVFARIRDKALSASIQKIQSDIEGRLWLQTTVGHYIIYDQRDHTVITDLRPILQDMGIGETATFYADSYYDVFIDSQGNLWLYQDRICLFYDIHKKRLQEIEGLIRSPISSLFVKDDICYIRYAGKVDMLDTHTLKSTGIIDLPGETTFHDKMSVDSQGNLWYGNNRIFRYERSSGTWEHIVEPVVSNLQVKNIVSDTEGAILVGTEHHGLFVYDLNGKLKNLLTHESSEITTITRNNINTVYCDDENNIWTGYNKYDLSISNVSIQGHQMHHLKSLLERNAQDDINAVCIDKEGNIWFGTEDEGIVVLDTRTGQEKVYSSKDGIGSDVIISFHCDSKGRIWIGSYKSRLSCYENGRFVSYKVSETPWGITEDSNGVIWLGTLGDGLYRVDEESANLQKADIGANWIFDLYADASGKLYAATTQGLFILDTQTMEVENLKSNRAGSQLFASEQIRNVYMDSRGLLWLLCTGGKGVVNIYNPRTDTILLLPELEDCDIKSFMEDDNKNIWITSDKGFINVSVGYDQAIHQYVFNCYKYISADSRWNNNHYNFRSAAKSRDGLIYFGGVSGYLAINPRLMLSTGKVQTPNIVFSGLKVNNYDVRVNEKYNGNLILTKDICFVKEISLGYSQNNITLYFMPLNTLNHFSYDYYYQLSDGKSADVWMSANNNTVTLSNIFPGKYTLAIKTKNNTETMDEVLATLLIHIRPPFWKSVAAYIVYALLLILGIAGMIYFLLQRQKKALKRQRTEIEAERQYQINEMKIRFFTNISHDFRTPLTLIITPLEDYLSRKKDEETQFFLTPVYKNALRLLHLVNQVLDFRRLEVYGATLNLSYGSIVEFVREICSSFTLFAEDTGVKLFFSSSFERLDMSFDKDKITKIMMNLLSNAFKFTPAPGTVSVKIEADATCVRIIVSDTGAGIDAADKERLFERFYQTASKSSTVNGCGIGLHIVKEFVELHKGTVTVEDNHPHGAVFICSLPGNLGAAETAHLPEEEASPYTEQETHEISDTATLLLIEDNEEFLNFLGKSLSVEYAVLKAKNGKEGLDILQSSQVDVVISDIMMDEMDGLAFCKKVKSDINISHIPIILLTAKALAEDELKGLDSGADDYITKPFNLSILKLRIKRLLDEMKRSRELFKKEIVVNPSDITITSLDEKLIADAIRIVEENMANVDFSVQMLSDELGMSRGHLYKKTTFITGKTPIEFIRMIRMKRAMQLLGKSQMYVSEVAYAVGFNSPKIFARYFREEFNMSPREYVKGLNENKKE
jgi:signal transduction histidine kinase/ligand-binding sensor domain-containing protein/AraC-like DNA-binding protein